MSFGNYIYSYILIHSFLYVSGKATQTDIQILHKYINSKS
jgi:hypothetical protein